MRVPLASAVAIACLVAPSTAVAQVPRADSPSVFEMPIANRFPGPFAVSEVDPKGTAKVVNQGFLNRAVPLIEGYYLMLVKADDLASLPRLFRVQVSDIGFKVLTIQVGVESAGGLRAGQRFDLWRPEGSTTAQLRSLPAVIPVARDNENEKPPELEVADGKAAALGRSLKNLREIGNAIHTFETEYGYFPPAVLRGPDGAPWHSWRSAVAPLPRPRALYKEYDFSQPWDGERNRELLARMPDVYRDAIRQDEPARFTDYAALVSEGSLPRGKRVGPRGRPSSCGRDRR